MDGPWPNCGAGLATTRKDKPASRARFDDLSGGNPQYGYEVSNDADIRQVVLNSRSSHHAFVLMWLLTTLKCVDLLVRHEIWVENGRQVFPQTAPAVIADFWGAISGKACFFISLGTCIISYMSSVLIRLKLQVTSSIDSDGIVQVPDMITNNFDQFMEASGSDRFSHEDDSRDALHGSLGGIGSNHRFASSAGDSLLSLSAISPSSQEKLCKAMESVELHDEEHYGKCTKLYLDSGELYAIPYLFPASSTPKDEKRDSHPEGIPKVPNILPAEPHVSTESASSNGVHKVPSHSRNAGCGTLNVLQQKPKMS
ncbi:hypothetical protein FNV43_RR21208 [Rhamnella rubrinervis]|uniref:Uncharacterized protein n=1 Tax=Rhamnella rubrinervis TaxID=2594499 RepID=A0A8K0GUW5_9ROSA|nr:hypothetical protein FNV43_RR21208 [Rhamnella rubrinervis]